MKATIWHNPNCSTSRKALDLLRAVPGGEVEVIDYLRQPPDTATLARLYAAAELTPHQGLRLKGGRAAELGLLEADEQAVLAAMAREPGLIERPLVETGKGVRLCRPVERVNEII